ncbi:MAG: membrane protein insertase YidC [Acidimicrobiia bacterium]|nr:membrane protein insertase YidC [Acidimicrobiia bacterium]
MVIWDSIRDGMGSILAFFYSIVPNGGIGIILLTVAVRLALFPLTAKQAKSMIAMQRVQPEIKKLQAKHKNDRQKLNEEMMKFYKENEINPLGGCLPLLLQMPVFFALFQTLHKIQDFIPTDSKMYADICGTAKVSACKPHMSFLGMDLQKSASQAAKAGLADAWPYLVLVGLVLITGYLQQRQTMRNQTTPNPQMAIISKVFPIVFGFISWGILSGVVLYFFTSNLWQIGQQEVVLRTIGTAAGPPPKKGKGELNSGSSSGSGKSGGTKVDDDPKSGGTSTKSTKPSTPKSGAKKPTTGAKGASGSPPSSSGNGARSNRKRKR